MNCFVLRRWREHIPHICFTESPTELICKLSNVSQSSRGVLHSSNGSESDEEVDFIFEPFLVCRKGVEHLRGALGVTDVGQLALTGLLKNEPNLSWQVVLSEFLVAIVIVFFRVTL